MNRRKKIVLAALLLVFPIVVILGWIQTEAFEDWVARQFIRSLEERGVHAVLDRVEIRWWGPAIVLGRLRLSAPGQSEPFLSVDRIETRLRWRSLFGGRLWLESVDIRQPSLFLRRLPDGRSNLDGLNWDIYRKLRPQGESLHIERLRIGDGFIDAVLWPDRRFGVEARRLRFSAVPDEEALRVQIDGQEVRGRIGDRALEQIEVSLQASISTGRVEILKAHLKLPSAETSLEGRIDLSDAIGYDLAVATGLNLEIVREQMRLEWPLSGHLQLTGQIRGRGGDFRFAGQLQSGEMRMGRLQLNGSTLNAESDRTIDLFGTLFGLASADPRVAGAGHLTGLLHINSASYAPLSLSAIGGEVEATGRELTFRKLGARLMGGEITGAATWSPGRGAQFTGEVKNLNVSETIAWLRLPAVPVDGRASGKVELESERITRGITGGTAHLKIEPPAGETSASALPITGDLPLRFAKQAILVDNSNLLLGSTSITASGQIGWTGAIGLDLRLRATHLRELEGVADALELDIKDNTAGFIDHLDGSAQFEGRLDRSPTEYRLEGNLIASQLPLKEDSLESLRTRLVLSSTGVELRNATLKLASGSLVELNVHHQIGAGSDTRADGRFREVDLARTLGPLGLKLPFSGLATGRVSLSRWRPEPVYEVSGFVSNGRLEIGKISAGFRQLSGSLHVNGTRYEVAESSMQLDAGQIAFSGHFDSANDDYRLKATGQNLALASLAPAVSQALGGAQGNVRFSLEGQGERSTPHFDGRINIDRLRLGEVDAGQAEVAITASGGPIQVSAALDLFGQRQTLEGSLDFSDPQQLLTARTRFEQFDVRPLLQLVREFPRDFEARISGSAAIRWPLISPEDLQVQLELPQVLLGLGEFKLKNDETLIAEWSRNRVALRPVRMSGADTNLQIGGTAEFGSRRGTSADGARESRADLNLEGQVNLQALRILYPGLATTGVAAIKASVRGSLRDPRLSGLADVRNASLRMVDLPISFDQGQGRIRFTSDQTLIENFRAHANGGEMSLSGGLIVKNFQADRWQFNIRADGMQFRYPAGVTSVLDASLSLNGSRTLQILSGNASIRRTEITEEADIESWITRNGQRLGRPARPALASTWPIALDLRIHGLDSVALKNDFADAVGSAWLHVSGPIDDPLISGRASISRGRLFFLNREYQITRGNFDLPDRRGVRARFDVEAETDISGYRVIISISGNPDRFQAIPRSEPTLPPQQVLALMTTARIGTPVESAQAAIQTSAGLTSALITEAISKRIELGTRYFGINRFQLAPLSLNRGSDPTARISVGRQVNRDLSITYSTNVASSQDQIIVIEYQISNRFSLVGTRDQDGKFSFDFRIRKRF